MPKVTDWFPGDVDPVRTGVYEIQTASKLEGGTFRYFDGEYWYYGEHTPDEALQMFQLVGQRVRVESSMLGWRGYACQPIEL